MSYKKFAYFIIDCLNEHLAIDEIKSIKIKKDKKGFKPLQIKYKQEYLTLDNKRKFVNKKIEINLFDLWDNYKILESDD